MRKGERENGGWAYNGENDFVSRPFTWNHIFIHMRILYSAHRYYYTILPLCTHPLRGKVTRPKILFAFVRTIEFIVSQRSFRARTNIHSTHTTERTSQSAQKINLPSGQVTFAVWPANHFSNKSIYKYIHSHIYWTYKLNQGTWQEARWSLESAIQSNSNIRIWLSKQMGGTSIELK